MKGCCSSRKTMRSEEEKSALINRLSRIEGQIRGIRRMVEDDSYCVDILTQAAAATSALKSFSKELLESHIRGCVLNDIRNSEESCAEELAKLIGKLL